MVTIERVQEILEELIREIPEEYYRELNGGVILNPECKVSPNARQQDLYIMGQYYKSRHLGRLITIYYGSFAALYPDASERVWRKRLRETLRHELTHHLESMAGEKDLEVEDALQMARYLHRGEKDGQ